MYFCIKYEYICHRILNQIMLRLKETNNKNNRLTAWLLLILFVCFSIQIPILSTEVRETGQMTELAWANLEDCIAGNSIYQAPVVKHDIGQHRVIMIYCIKSGGLLIPGLNQESETILKQPTETFFPTAVIPAYLFERVLRI